MDPIYFKNINTIHFVNNTIYPVRKLSEIANLQRGRFGHRPRNDPAFYNGEYPFIQTGNVVEASVSNEKIRYSQTLNAKGLGTSRLFEPDVLVITIAANIGDTAILDYPACFPDSLVGITPKLVDVNIYYLNYYLRFIKKYLEYLAPQSAQKNINLQQLSPTPIVLPPLERQQEIVDIFNAAYQQKQEKETQAKQLLAGIDDYLLSELGITLPEQDNSLNKRIFTTKFSKLTGSRFDPEYFNINYSEKIVSITKGNYDLVELLDVTSNIYSGKTPSKDEYSELTSLFPIIKAGSYTGSSINLLKVDYCKYSQKNEVKKGDIFILSAAHQSAYVGKQIKILEDEPIVKTSFVGELICIRVNVSKYDAMFLFSLLNLSVYKDLINREKTGQTSHIYAKDIQHVKIPLPPLEKQKEIAAKISKIRHEAKRLQEDGANILANAKIRVEQMILGN